MRCSVKTAVGLYYKGAIRNAVAGGKSAGRQFDAKAFEVADFSGIRKE